MLYLSAGGVRTSRSLFRVGDLLVVPVQSSWPPGAFVFSTLVVITTLTLFTPSLYGTAPKERLII
jgi:hypothetical protein